MLHPVYQRSNDVPVTVRMWRSPLACGSSATGVGAGVGACVGAVRDGVAEGVGQGDTEQHVRELA